MSLKDKVSAFFSPPQVSENFCIVPWTHTFISPQSERRLCCASREKSQFVNQYIDAGQAGSQTYSPETLEQHWNSEYMKSIRRRMLRGEKISECEVCNDKVLNLSVYRDWFNKAMFPHKIKEVFDKTDDSGFTSMSPISFDYRIHNTCNFKCRMCGEQLSSSWEHEKRKFNDWSPDWDLWMRPEINQKIQDFQQQVVEKEFEQAIDRGLIEEAYWVGGEPLVWDFHWKMMDKMVRQNIAGQVFCRYNTNLSRIEHQGKHLFRDLLPHFKGYLICASIDGVGEIGEWLRTGLRWKNFYENFKSGQQGKGGKASIAMDVTLTLPGLFSLEELFQVALELQTPVITKIIFAFDPAVVMSPLALPKSLLHPFLDELIEKIEPHVTVETQSILQTLRDLKTRPTFDEQYSNTYLEGFVKGRQRVRQIAQRRGDGSSAQPLTIEKIYASRPEILSWWTREISTERDL